METWWGGVIAYCLVVIFNLNRRVSQLEKDIIKKN